jgi:hypothetical protein
METVKVRDVEKSGTGWYEITLEDDRTISTKNQAMADAAFASRGTEVEVEINEVQKGTYTNRYLNKFGDIGDTKPKSAPRSGGGGARPEKNQEAIRKQWAFGRALELLRDSQEEYSFPLSTEDFQKVQLQADALLAATKV